MPINRTLCIFPSIFSSAQPAPMLGNADLRYHFSRLNQNTQHISCRVYMFINFRHATRHDEEIPTCVQLEPIQESNMIKFNPLYISNGDLLDDTVEI